MSDTTPEPPAGTVTVGDIEFDPAQEPIGYALAVELAARDEQAEAA